VGRGCVSDPQGALRFVSFDTCSWCVYTGSGTSEKRRHRGCEIQTVASYVDHSRTAHGRSRFFSPISHVDTRPSRVVRVCSTSMGLPRPRDGNMPWHRNKKWYKCNNWKGLFYHSDPVEKATSPQSIVPGH